MLRYLLLPQLSRSYGGRFEPQIISSYACKIGLEHPKGGDLWGNGLLLRVELVKGKISKEPAEDVTFSAVLKYFLGRQLNIGRTANAVFAHANVLILYPPLVIPLKKADLVADDFYQATLAMLKI